MAFVDHKPLTFVMAKVSEPWSAWQLFFISEFTTDVRHVAGKNNQVADCLSHSLASAIHFGVDYARMVADQVSDADVQAYRTKITGLWLADLPFSDCGATLLWDVSTGQPRPVVLEVWCRRVFDTIHSLSHPGGKASRKLVAWRLSSSGMDSRKTSVTGPLPVWSASG